METTEKTVKIYDANKKLLGIGLLLSLNKGIIKVKGYDLPVINSTTEIYIEVYNEFSGIIPYFCSVSIASSNQLNANILRVEPTIERRNSLKVKTDLSFYIDSLERDEEDISKDFPNMKINILNLSIGGMLISSNYELKINDIITFKFQYLNFQIILLRAKVIRIDKIYDYKTKELTAFNYGCAFKNLRNNDENIITKYLFDRQLKLYKNR